MKQATETIKITLDYCKLDSTDVRTRVFYVTRPETDSIIDFADEAEERLDAYVREELGWSDYEVVDSY